MNIKTAKRKIGDEVESAAYQAAHATMVKYNTEDEDFLRLAFAEAFLSSSKIATGDNFSQVQFYQLVKNGYNVALSVFLG